MVAIKSLTEILRDWSEVFMRRSARDFKKFMDGASLSFSQVSVLMHLYHAETAGVSELGRKMGVTNAAASQAMDRLVNLGLIARSEDPHDRRIKRLVLTEKGRDLVARAIDARSRWIEGLTLSLSPAEQEQIISALVLVTAAAKKIQD